MSNVGALIEQARPAWRPLSSSSPFSSPQSLLRVTKLTVLTRTTAMLRRRTNTLSSAWTDLRTAHVQMGLRNVLLIPPQQQIVVMNA